MKKTAFAAILIALALAGCSRSNMAAWDAWSKPHHIKQFSGSVLIGEWDSTGKVDNDGGNGYSFQDAKTGKNVRISGHVTLTLND
jgi:outer membrane lipoprotein SlyB